ncbi:MAG: carbohydrate kinase family protein [Acidilobaceae archaeon]
MDLSASSKTFVSVGNLNIDIVMFVSRSPRAGEGLVADDLWLGPGGAATNYAVAVAKLGHRVSLVAIASSLALKLGLLETLRSLGVDVSHVIVSEGPPSVASVVVSREDSSRTIISYRGVSSHLSHDHIPRAGDHFHFASVSPGVVLGYVAENPERAVSYDPGAEVRRDREGVFRALKSVEIAIVARQELEALLGSAELERACRLLERGSRAEVAVVKMGERGAVALTRGKSYLVESPRVRVVDTTGAGDAFDAGFTVGLVEESDVEWALRLGVAMGSLKVTLKGSSSMPDRRAAVELAESLASRELSLDCS